MSTRKASSSEMRGDGGRGGVHGGVEHIYLDETHEVNRSSGSRRSSSTYDRARSSSQQNSQSTPASSADQNLLGGNHDSDDDSTPRGLRQESSRSGSSAASASPFDSTDGGGGISGAGVGDMAGTGGSRSSSGASGTGGGGAVRALPEVGTRPATVGNVPFGASALSKTRSNNGRGRPRGLRPRGNSSRSFSSVDGGSASGGGRMNSARTFSSRGSDRQEEREAIALAVAEEVAPGVSMEEVVQAAVKIQSVVRVLIARGYVRRKLVSEVTAFSLIMERGIEVIKHPFSGKGKPKNVTVNFVSRKGAMQLSWGGKQGVPLETIFGVTKGIKTEALSHVVGPDRAENCFSLLTPDRTIDFEVDNPWLVLLVVRAMRLFLGAHYDTLPAPTFFSHLCVRPRGSDHMDSPRQTLVWTGASDKGGSGNQMVSPPTERTSGESIESDSDETGAGGDGSGDRSPWARIEESNGRRADGEGDYLKNERDAYPSIYPSSSAGGDTDCASGFGGGIGDACLTPPRVPDHQATDGSSTSRKNHRGLGEIYLEHGDNDHGSFGDGKDGSPGGVMALFSSGRREGGNFASGSSGGGMTASDRLDLVGESSQNANQVAGREREEDAPLTASQVLATRGATKRLNLSKQLRGSNEKGAALKGRRFNLMALPADSSQQDRREKGPAVDVDIPPKRTQGMSISIGAEYRLPEEQDRTDDRSHDPERSAIVDDLNNKLQSLRKLCVPQQRLGNFRSGFKQPKTMAVKNMAFFQGVGGSTTSSGMGSVADMWGDGVRRQYQTDIVRQKNESVEDVAKRDGMRTAMLVNRSGVHRVTRRSNGSVEQR